VRMAEHDKQKDEVIYYQGKVATLRSSREAARKPESAADKDKYERNVKKLMDQEAEFFAMDSALTAELRYAFEHRVAVLGPIMLAFVCAEREIATRYTQAIHEVKLVDVNEANTWLAKHEAAMAAKAVQVQTITTTKTVVTDLQHSPQSPALTVMTVDHKEANAHDVPSSVQPAMGGVAVGHVSNSSMSGVMIGEPQFAGHNGTSSEVDAFAAPQLQSPKGANSSFDSFEAAFEKNAAFSDPFYSVPTASHTAGTADAGVPYTIGSTTTHSAPSTTSTSSASTANGTISSFPVESSIPSAHTTTSDVAPAVMDDMTLEKTRGAEQLDGSHGAIGVEKSDVHDSSTYGVGEKTDVFAAPAAGASHVV